MRSGETVQLLVAGHMRCEALTSTLLPLPLPLRETLAVCNEEGSN
jgi:hypothetical protein